MSCRTLFQGRPSTVAALTFPWQYKFWMVCFPLSGSLYRMICRDTFSKNAVFIIDGVTHTCGAVSEKTKAVINEFGAFLIVAAGHKTKKYFAILCHLFHG